MMSLQFTPPASLLFLVVMSGVESQTVVQYNQKSICAVKGSTVTMSCTSHWFDLYRGGRIFWSKEAYTAGMPNEPPDLSLDPEYRNRVQYIRNTKDSRLRLSNVTEQDQRKYYAQILFRGKGLDSGDGVELSVTDLQVELITDRVVEGNSVTLTCKTTCILPDTTTLTWYKNGRVLYSDYSWNPLSLPSVSEKDAGSYSCAVNGQSYQSPAVTLNVGYHPKSVSVSISPSGLIVSGSSVSLTCSSNAKPRVRDYSWYKGMDIIATGTTYDIHRISSADSGDYRCKASNPYGEGYSKYVLLNVLDPPKSVSVSISPSAAIVEGSSVTLTCSSDANPPVEYNWFKGSELKNIRNTYTINKISSEDSGDYKCKAKNKDGEKYSAIVTVNVLYPPRSVSVSISPSAAILEGSSVTLTCSSDANPPVEYNWFKGSELKNIRNTYTISRISSEDSGDYKCRAKNKDGEKYSAKVTVNVLYPPRKVSVSISPSGEIVEGSSVTLTCSSDANPPVHDYTWYKGNTFIQTGQSYIIERISPEEDSEDYICKAKSKHGRRSSTAVSLKVLYPPRSVSVSINSSGQVEKGGSVTLTCSSDANPPVHDYTWYKVNESSPVGSGQSYSFMMNFSSSEWFYCVAQNKYGSQRAAAVSLGSDTSQISDNSLYVVVVCVAVGVCVCVVGAFIAGIFCMRRKRQTTNRGKYQDGATPTEDNTYASLDHMTRSSNDVYNTLATVHYKPPDNTYEELDLQSICSDYETVPNTTGLSIRRLY